MIKSGGVEGRIGFTILSSFSPNIKILQIEHLSKIYKIIFHKNCQGGPTKFPRVSRDDHTILCSKKIGYHFFYPFRAICFIISNFPRAGSRHFLHPQHNLLYRSKFVA